MANYNVGNIEIGLITSTTKTIASFDKVIEKLKQFNQIDKNLQNVFFRINQLGNGLKKIERIDVTALSGQIDGISNATRDLVSKLQAIEQPNFDKTAKSLNQISNAFRQFNKLGDLEFENLKKVFNNLTIAIDPFLAKLRESEGTLTSLATILNRLHAKTITKAGNEIDKASSKTKRFGNNLSGASKKLHKFFNFSMNLGKMYFLFNYSKRIIGSIKNIIAQASNYTEILNKFQVSYGDLYETNLASTTKLAEAFGFSSNTLLDYTSTFNNMLKSLKGLSDKTSATISQTLTRMAIDYSSIFNVSVDRAMKSFQSALSGNVRSLRDVSGFDTSETTIYSVYQNLGGTKTMRQLNQLEKRILRIIAIQQQMEETGALGDYARTIETVSNQVKIMQETLIEVGKYIGQNILIYIKPLIQYANGLLLALKEMLKTLSLTKQEVDNIDYEKEFASFGNSVEETSEAVEELNEQLGILLGFDKLNVLGNTSTTASNIEGLSVEGSILNALKEYNINLDEISYKAKEISKQLLSWAGFTYNAEKRVWEFTSTIEDVLLNLIKVATEKLFDLAEIVVNVFTEVGPLILEKLPGYAQSIIEEIIAQLPRLVNAVWEFITTMFSNLSDFVKNIKDVIKNTTPDLVSFLMDFVAQVIEDLPSILMDISNAIIELTPLILETTDVLLASIIKNLPKFITALMEGFADNLPIVVEYLLSSVASLVNYLIEFITNPESLSALLTSILDILVSLIAGVVKMIPSLFKTIGTAIVTVLAQAFGDGLEALVNGVINIINSITESISEIWTWTGASAIPKIPHVDFANYIPALANGGVITKPTTALVGEYAGAKSNPEIVTPESLMRQVFVESMLPIAQAIVSGNSDVVSAIEDLANRPIEMNGRKVSESIYSDLQKVALRKGQTLFATNI